MKSSKFTLLVNVISYLFIYSFILVYVLLPLRADYLAPVLPQVFHSVINRQQQKYKTEQRVYTSR